MRTLLALTLAVVSLTGSIASAASKPSSRSLPVTRAACPKAPPFALPDARLSAGWSDLEWELWAVSTWNAYCAGRESTHVCRCAEAFGGGPY